jgi:hypothetical protein
MQTAVNPQTGERVQWNGTAWVPAGRVSAPAQPAPSGQPAQPAIRFGRKPVDPAQAEEDALDLDYKRKRNATPIADPNAPKLPTGYRWKNGIVGGEAERIPGTAGADGTAIPAGEFNTARGFVGQYESLRRSADTFDDDFGGNVLGGVENTLQAYGFDFGMATPGQSEWWADFKGNDNVIRNELFGSALTDTEKAAYSATTIEPGMSPDKIKANLKRRADILQNALMRDRDFMLANGRKPEAVDAIYRPILEAQRRLEENVANADVRDLPRLPQGTQIEFGMDGGDQLTGFRFNPQQLSQLQTFMAQNPNASAAEVNAFATGAFGRTLGTPEQVEAAMAYYRQTGRMPGIDYSREDAARQAQLDAELAARGQAGGANTSALIAQGLTGLTDEASGVAGGIANLAQGRSFVDGYMQERDLVRRSLEVGREREGVLPELVGNIVSPVGAFRAPAATLRGAAAQGAAGGAYFGFAGGEGTADTIVDTAAGAGLGAVLGAGAQRLLGGRGGGGGGGTPRPAAQAYQDQLNAGVPNPTLGSTMGGSAAIAENALALSPGGGRVAANIRENVAGAAQGAQGLADRFGPGGSFTSRGEALIEGANKWRDKAQAVVGKAYDAIPISPKAPASTPNTRAFLDGQADRFDSPVLQQAFANGKMAQFSDAVDAGLTWRDIKGWRTEIGDLIGEALIVGDRLGKKQLRGLYASLSDDMKATATALGPDALRKFERANTLNRQKEERLEKALVSILGKDGTNPAERAAKLIDTISLNNSGTADIKKLAEIRKSIPGDEWDSVSSSMIRLMGQPLNKESRDFSPQTFLTAFKNMDPAAKNIIFGKSDLRKELDGFANAMEGLATVQNSGNPSGTARVVNMLFGLTNVGTLGAQALTANVVSRLWANPRFVQWATGYTKMVKGAAKAGKMPTAANIEKQLNLGGKAAAAAGASANDVLNMQAALRSAFEQSPGRLAAEPTDEQGQM